MSSTIKPVNLEIQAVNSLIAAIGMMDGISTVSYYCTDYSLNNFSTSSTTRENNFLVQIEIAEKLSRIVCASFEVRKTDYINFNTSHDYIIDVGAIKMRQALPERDRLKLLAVSPESMNPLLAQRYISSIGILKSRWKCFQNLYKRKSVPMRVHSFLPSRYGAVIEITNILGLDFERRIRHLAKEFSVNGYSEDFSGVWSYLESNPDDFFVIVLPTPNHYGGTEEEDLLISRYLLSNFEPEKTTILIKNHPSDLERHLIFDKELSQFSMTYWDSKVSRNLPIELLTIPFQDRLCLLSTGSSAQYSMNPKSSRLVTSPTKYARKLYKNIYGSLNLFFGISSV
jgi:hypothetical protein